MTITKARTRFLLACGVALASAFLVLEFSRPPGDGLDQIDDALAFEQPIDRVRILLRSHGQGPWLISSASELTLESSIGTRFVGRDLVVATTKSGFLVDDKPAGSSLSMSTRAVFKLNSKKLQGQLFFDADIKKKRPILVIEMEQYLAQVLPSEMPLAYPDAALEAQVIASRSYAIARILGRRRRKWDMTDGESSQMFSPVTANTVKAETIVARTRGLVLSFDETIVSGYFSANCGGATRSNKEAFGEEWVSALKGVACSFCSWSKNYRWVVTLSRKQFDSIAGLAGMTLQSASIVRGTGSGYTNKISCRTASGRKLVSAKKLRTRLGNRKIRSNWLSGIDFDEQEVTIGGRGFGHGVGLCQNGACGMAQDGHNAKNILAYYFPGAKLVRTKETSNP